MSAMISRMTISAAAGLALGLSGATLATSQPMAASARHAHADHSVMVGGAAMYPTKTIVENAANSKDHTTLVAALKAVGLVETLSGPGPFTVFAPTNAAFAKLPTGAVDTLMKSENKAALAKVLSYHVLPGAFTSAELMAKAKVSGGKVILKTVGGEDLIVSAPLEGGMTITDAKGNVARVAIADVNQSNGVIHVVDTVLMP